MSIELGSVEFWKHLESDPKLLAAEVCKVDTVNLEQTLERHSGIRAWVNAAHESARIEEAKAEYEVTKARARALLKSRESDDQHTGKAKIADILKAEVELDKDVDALTQRLFDVQMKRGALRAMSTAMEDRLQMLIQISANQRKEYNS